MIHQAPSAEVATQAGFARWVEPHWAAMAALAARAGQDSDDVLQEALTVAWRKRHRFDPARGSARNWLLALTADQRRKHWRSLAGRRETPGQVPESGSSDSYPCVDLERALEALSKRQRLAVELHYYLGLGIADVAEVMRCAPGTVKSTLADARNKLKDILGGDYL